MRKMAWPRLARRDRRDRAGSPKAEATLFDACRPRQYHASSRPRTRRPASRRPPRARLRRKGTMYAVIESGGKQYRVQLGTELAVDRLDVEPGQTIEFEHVLLVADEDRAAIGQPLVKGARVSADVVRQDRGDKIVVFKYRPKARSRVKQGHRADLTILRVSDIELDGKSARKLAADAVTERQRLEAASAEEAARQAAADKALAAKLAKEAKAAETAAAAEEKPAKPATKAKDEPKAATKAKAEPKAGAGAKAAPKAPKTAASRTQAPPPAARPKAPRATKPTKKDEEPRGGTRKPGPARATAATASASGSA